MSYSKKLFRLCIYFLTITFIFICTNNVNAAQKKKRRSLFRKVKTAEENVSPKTADLNANVTTRRAPCKVSQIKIPDKFGITKDSFKGTDNRLIIHVQDAHCNYEAQTNIYKMIEIMAKDNKLTLLAVEGSEGFIDTSPFSSFPDKKVKMEVAEYFMKKGRITGPEYICITGEYDFDLFGIENKEDYTKNLNAFKKTMPYREKFKPVVEALKEILDKLKLKIFNLELIQMDSKLVKYEKEEIEFSDYCKYLLKTAQRKKIDIIPYKNIKLFGIISELESAVDFKKVDKERNEIVDNIKAKLSKRYMSELIMKTTHYKKGKITAGQYHGYIVNLAKGRGIDMKKFLNLDNYTKYMNAFENMEHDTLLKEKEQIETVIKKEMYDNTTQKTLDDLNKTIKNIGKFYQLELDRNNLEYFRKNKELFSFAKFVAFIGTYAHKYDITYDLPSNMVELDNYFGDLENFYFHAERRDHILIDNTLKRMKEKDVNIALMVCGGFHTEGMMKILKDKNISYVVLAPTITQPDDDNPYLDILLGRTSPLDDLMENEDELQEEEA